ncbi:hypothetical protein BD414DRAFT_467136 [Trametes punicea]|nr:hypothetical protein BD414DRAFT_467136 [Trametes punicea]
MSNESSSAGLQKDEVVTHKRPLSAILSETYVPFDHSSKVVTPYEDEAKRDAEFLAELNTMLLELILDFHAWSTARPTHESDKAADSLEKEIRRIREIEQEQGRSSLFQPQCTAAAPRLKTRQKLHDFITRIKLALAALTGLA